MRWFPENSLVVAGVLSIAAACSAQGTNLARGSRVLWSPAPNYEHCTDDEDARQLVDGHRLRSSRGWTESDMVGWGLAAGSRVLISIDLGRRAQVASVVLSTRHAADSEVLPPTAVLAVGQSDTTLHWAAAVDSRPFHEDPRSGSRKIDLTLRPAHPVTARWVHLVLTLQEDFLFLDEIEVWGSTAAPGPTRAADPIDPSAFLRRSGPEGDRVAAQQRRLWALQQALPGSLPVDHRFPAVSVTAEEAQRLRRRARQWRRSAADSTQWFGIRRVDPFTARHRWSPPGTLVQDTLRVAVGEWGVAACDAWWAGENPLQVAVGVEAHAASGLSVTLRSAECVEVRDETWVDDALPRLRDPMTLQPGASRQVWLDVDARQATPGVHTLIVMARDRHVLIPVVVVAARRPRRPPLATANFTYPTRRPLLRDNPVAAIRDNEAAGINSWIFDAGAVPWPRPGSIADDGSRTIPLDFAAADHELDLISGSAAVVEVGWYWNFWMEHVDPSGGRFRHPYLGDAWKRAVSQWLSEWMTHLQTIGWSRREVFMQPVDERGGRRVEELIRTLKSLAPDVRLALTFSEGQSARDLEALLPWLDVAILNRDIVRRHPGFIEAVHRRGGEVWTYGVPSPAKSTSPVDGYRMLAWEAWSLGLQGCAFWSYADVAGDSWDDFDGDHCDFSVVYANRDTTTAGAEPFVPSKRWRAFRLGMQDVGRFDAAARRSANLRTDVRAAVDDPERRADVLRRSFP